MARSKRKDTPSRANSRFNQIPVGIRPPGCRELPASRELVANRTHNLLYCIHNITIHGEIACIVHVHNLELTCKSEDTQN